MMSSFFRLRTYRELRKGYETELIYRSPEGQLVTRDDATLIRVEILRGRSTHPSERMLAQAIGTLTELLCRNSPYTDYHYDFEEVSDALEEMLADSRSMYEIGSKVLSSSLRNQYHLNRWDEMEWAIKILGNSKEPDATNSLIDMCNIDNEGVDHYNTMQSIANAAREAIETIIEQFPSQKQDVWIQILLSLYPDNKIRACEVLGEIGTEEAIPPLEQTIRLGDEGYHYRGEQVAAAARAAVQAIRHRPF